LNSRLSKSIQQIADFQLNEKQASHLLLDKYDEFPTWANLIGIMLANCIAGDCTLPDSVAFAPSFSLIRLCRGAFF